MSAMSFTPEVSIDLVAVRRRVAEVAVRTPLVPAPALSEMSGADVWLKLETVQPTGSFKVRGAASKILAVERSERSSGVVTASTGNHGRAVAYVARRLGIPATVCISTGVPSGKVAALEALGASVVVVGETQSEAMERALEIAATDGAVFVHPFDDLDVIAGQATIGVEIAEDLAGVATVVVPLSGGGLMAGIATASAELTPHAALVGVSMSRVPIMSMSLETRRPVEEPEEKTLADSLRGGIGLDNRHTFRIVSDLVDQVVLVDEDAIWRGMRFMFDEHRLMVEGGGAVGVAALLTGAIDPLASPVVIVISGANIEPATAAALLTDQPAPTT
ncbi:hydroxyectoine utilization dehydratase EutB [soil metagenome]